MKLFSTLVASAAVASSAILPRQGSPALGFFDLTDFSISGVRGSISVFYRFNVQDSIGGASTSCSWTTTSTPDVIPFDYVPCQDPSFSFAWFSVNATPTPAGAGWSLQITHSTGEVGGKNQTSCHFFPQSDFKVQEDPNPNLDYTYLDAEPTQQFNWEYKDRDQCIYQ